MDSRSSSPETLETPETSDGPCNVAIHNDRERPPWYHALHLGKNVSVVGAPDGDAPLVTLQKPEVERMLQLDDLIEEHAYDDSACSGVAASPSFVRPLLGAPHSGSAAPANDHWTSPQANPPESQFCVPLQSQMRCTLVVPPPAIRPRKRDPTTTPHRVVHPPRESCYNLAIMTPNIPKSGTKSRVETQVRVTVDLAHASSSSGEQYQYDRVGSWKWLKLPPGTSTKKRTRREGKIDPAPWDVLHLSATVTCASAPHNRVFSCGSCRNREAKRVARKLAARIRPVRSDSDTLEDGSERTRSIVEDTTSIIQFNCPEVLDFSTGSAVLPVRITCYCRHHREKVGFHIHFTVMDHNGRVVGTGITPPIMITDDHKSTVKSGAVLFNSPIDAEAECSRLPADNGAPSKRMSGHGKGQPKKRAKPYDSTSRTNQARFARETSVASLSSSVNSPSMQPSTVPNTRSPTPSHPSQSSASVRVTHDPAPIPLLPTFVVDAESTPPPFNSNGPLDPALSGISSAAIFSPPNGIPTVSTEQMRSPSDTHSCLVTGQAPQPSQLLSTLVSPQPMPFMFFNPGSPPPITSLPIPKIHRLIPASGPTHGGIEVTILGENFHPAIQLNCVFGGVLASSTQRWSDNTLLCVLPPRSVPGVVAVWFEGFDNTKNTSLPSLFTYTDESDRALMELALQVVGLKMTGKIEDAKNVALRIVGTTGIEDSPSSTTADIMQVASSSYDDIRPLLFLRSGQRDNYEAAVVKFLTLVDISVKRQSNIPLEVAVSHTTPSGHTLLHLAVYLKFASLTRFLIAHDIDLDARDRNGYTALHCAALAQSRVCAKLLVDAGADLEIVDALGKTAQDIAPADFFEGIIDHGLTSESDMSPADDNDGESHWGDVETDEDSGAVIIKRKLARVLRRPSNRRAQDSSEKPDGDTSHASSQPQEAPNRVEDIKDLKIGGTADEKQAASFVDLIQRTLAQLHAPQGIIPNMPQLPLPNLPEMMPAVPWGALPQIPMVFPVFVPMPGWPSFLSDKREGPRDEDLNNKDKGDARPAGYSAARTAQELRATWEKWMTLAVATATLRPTLTEEAPPMYTPRETQEGTAVQQSVTSALELQEVDLESTARVPNALDRPNRRMSHEVTSMQAQDVDAYGYVSVNSHTEKTKKHDRMLVLFWLPILLMSLLWAFHNGIRFAVHALKTTLFMKAGVRA
ncbi:hypothetical protein PAXRUDRAFT_34656 [Paxillus rubicundulus Ve08.2h10]|uniref:IPT/TIG domain-containing protein n=1 Tax=Paxillus rubicundulus Ve08.2h10 TaxID=930991 RepID=A0A0D0D5W9_9AGAM|nr:hypothetical protein PAXRUDRAFT_34656 [Paxillus rubicundulus Ve08.2h10]